MKNSKLLVVLAVLLTMGMLLGACAPAATPTATAAATTAAATTAAATTAAATTAAATTAAAPVTIRYWHTHSDTESAELDKVIAAFEAANPGIKVEATRYAYDDFKTALTTAIAGGDVPDVARLDIIWVPQFASQGALMQLDGAMSDFDTISKDVFPGPLATNKWQDHYYGLPLDTNTTVLIYNKDLFSAAGLTAPTTVQEFADDACKLTDASKGVYGFAMGGTYFWAPAPLFYTMGGKVTDDKITTATGYINGPESVAVFTMLKDLYDKKCLSPNLLGGGVATDAGSGSGKYAMIIDGPWMTDIYKSNYPNFNYDYAAVPAGTNGSSSVVGGEDIVILDGSKNKEAAEKWVDYLMSPDVQKEFAQVGVMPTRSSLTGDSSLPAYFNVFMKQLSTAQARTVSPHWDDMDTAINNAFQHILKGDQTVQASLDQAATEINALIAKQ